MWFLTVPILALVFALGMWSGHGGCAKDSDLIATGGDRKGTEAKESEKDVFIAPHKSKESMASRLEVYLAGKGSPMKGCGGAFVSYADTFGIDPRLVVAISGAESSFGKHVCGDHNAWNWFHCYASGDCAGNPCGNSPFPTWSRGGRTVAKFLKRSYLNKGFTTLELIGAKYCVEGCDHWVPNVKTFYSKELEGNPNDLTWPTVHHRPAV